MTSSNEYQSLYKKKFGMWYTEVISVAYSVISVFSGNFGNSMPGGA
jgi:hypothetical protein